MSKVEYYVPMYGHGHLSLFRVRDSWTFTDIYEIYDIYEEYMLKLLASDAKNKYCPTYKV
jgi:hypothetical protein